MKAESRQIPQKLTARLKFVCCRPLPLNFSCSLMLDSMVTWRLEMMCFWRWPFRCFCEKLLFEIESSQWETLSAASFLLWKNYKTGIIICFDTWFQIIVWNDHIGLYSNLNRRDWSETAMQIIGFVSINYKVSLSKPIYEVELLEGRPMHKCFHSCCTHWNN